jgi:hypothetical protein
MPGKQVVVDHAPGPRGLPGAHDPGGFEELSVGEGIAVAFEVRSQVVGGLLIREPTMNENLASSNALRLAADSIPASATTTVSDTFWRFGEVAQDAEQGGCLGGVALEAGHLEREPGRVDEQPELDLRVDSAFLALPHLRGFLLGYEVQRGDVAGHKRRRTRTRRVPGTGAGDDGVRS